MATTRQLFPLKALTSLAICDLSANPVTLRSEYRHFIIYHCSSLKALDGTAIVSGRVVNSVHVCMYSVCEWAGRQ